MRTFLLIIHVLFVFLKSQAKRANCPPLFTLGGQAVLGELQSTTPRRGTAGVRPGRGAHAILWTALVFKNINDKRKQNPKV